jgi:hypothetical protein
LSTPGIDVICILYSIYDTVMGSNELDAFHQV